MAESVAGQCGVEAGLEEVVGVVVDEAEVECDPTRAGFEEIACEAATRGECMGDGAVSGAQPRVAGDGRAQVALPAGGFEGEALVEGGVESGAVNSGDAGAAVYALEGERADLGLELAGAPAQVAAELAADLAVQFVGARRQRQVR